MPSPFAAHVTKWSNCRACDLCLTRQQVVLARGTVPCKILMLGEAPGESEDVLGQPFIGPAGKLLSRIVQEAMNTCGYNYPVAWTNVIACIPKSQETLRKNAEPLAHEIEACRPRLMEFIRLAKPTLIVRVGEVAKKHLTPEIWKGKLCAILHPAAILRAPIENRALAIKRCQVDLTDAFAAIDTPTTPTPVHPHPTEDDIPF